MENTVTLEHTFIFIVKFIAGNGNEYILSIISDSEEHAREYVHARYEIDERERKMQVKQLDFGSELSQELFDY